MKSQKTTGRNVDPETVEGFGDEWSRFDQTHLDREEAKAMFDGYFRIFPWGRLDENSVGFDLGCGSGRWAKIVAPRVGILHLIDASAEAIAVARRNLAASMNCVFHVAAVDQISLPDESMDFGYSLGVLHHVPDTQRGIRDCVKKLKPGAPFLVYLYYRFDNRPGWFRAIWRISDFGRKRIARFGYPLRNAVSQVIAGTVYWPLARASLLLEKLKMNVEHLPLSAYRDRSFYSMRTDALDRFGTSLEQRFTRLEIQNMMEAAGLERVEFSELAPYWCALGYRKKSPGRDR